MQKDCKNIAIVHPIMIIGGAERLVIDLALSLKSKDHKITLFTTSLDRKCAFQEVLDGTVDVQTFGNKIPNLIFNRFQLIMSIFKMFLLTIYMMLFKQRYDLYIVDSNPYVLPIFWIFRRKVIFYCHFPDALLAAEQTSILFKFYRFVMALIEEFCFLFVHSIWVNSQFTKSKFIECFPRLKKVSKTITVVYPCLNFSYLDEIAEEKSEKPFDLPNNYFLSLNRIEKKKKIELAIHAFAKMKQNSPQSNCKLIIAGGFVQSNFDCQSYYDFLLKEINSLGLNNDVLIFTNVSNYKKLALLKGCIATLYTPPNEHFGIVPIEAMYLSKPVICQNNGGPLESVGTDCGFLLEENSTLWAEKMLNLLSIYGLSKTMGSKAKKNVLEKFSFESFADIVNLKIKNI